MLKEFNIKQIKEYFHEYETEIRLYVNHDISKCAYTLSWRVVTFSLVDVWKSVHTVHIVVAFFLNYNYNYNEA